MVSLEGNELKRKNKNEIMIYGIFIEKLFLRLPYLMSV